MLVPSLSDGAISIRPIRLRDARQLEHELIANRSWLRKWEATIPHAPLSFDTRANIRWLQQAARAGVELPFLIEYQGELAGQINVSSIRYGSISSANIGYWVAERFAGRNIIPTVVALVTDYCFFSLGLHRMEIVIRTENTASLRVVEKLGFRYEGLRRGYWHINGDWRDHFCFALVSDELPTGVLRRWKEGRVPLGQGSVPEADRTVAETPIATRLG